MRVKIMNRSLNDMPEYATEGSAGMDLRANLRQVGNIVLEPGDREIIPTGIHIQLPRGYEAQVRSKSGLAAKRGIAVLNSPGTIDSDYIGEIGVILINQGKENFMVEDGDKIAQLVVAKYEIVTWEAKSILQETGRGDGGFGSTGTK